MIACTLAVLPWLLSQTALEPAPSDRLPRSLPAVEQEFLVEAVVARVNQSVITLGQVDAEARIILVRRGGKVGAGRAIDDGLRAAVLQYLINQEVILAEARRLQMFQVSDEEIGKEARQIGGLFGDDETYQAFLAANGLAENDIEEIVRRDLRVAKFLKSRIRMLSRMQLEELRAYYASHPQEFAGKSFEEVRPQLEERLGRVRNEEGIRQWVDALKARSEIRVLRVFEDPKR